MIWKLGKAPKPRWICMKTNRLKGLRRLLQTLGQTNQPVEVIHVCSPRVVAALLAGCEVQAGRRLHHLLHDSVFWCNPCDWSIENALRANKKNDTEDEEGARNISIVNNTPQFFKIGEDLHGLSCYSPPHSPFQFIKCIVLQGCISERV